MRQRNKLQQSRSRQQGVTLLIFSVVIILGVVAYVVSSLSINQLQQKRQDHTQLVLNKAKQALLDYAVARAEVSSGASRKGEWGFLPCPDYNGITGEGNQGANCESTNESDLGLLPYRALDLDVLNDGNGDCLYYAVSGAYKQSPETGMLNEDSNGYFQLVDNNGVAVTGINPEDRIVAIVISPGKVLPGQSRNFSVGSECGKDYANLSAYLDSNGITDNAVLTGVADVIDQFLPGNALSALETNPYNDRMITLSRQEVWNAVLARPDFNSKMNDLTEALAMCLASYANSAPTVQRLPWPATVALADYRNNDDYTDVAGIYGGRYPFIVSVSNIITGYTEAEMADSELFNLAACKTLTPGSGAVVNLKDDFTEYRHLWRNWKDHFFYALSANFSPGSAVGNCLASCLTVNGVPYAAVVFYSGSRLAGVTRHSPPLDAADDKANISNYLENGNDQVLINADGTAADSYNANNTNDIMFCLQNSAGAGSALVVTPC